MTKILKKLHIAFCFGIALLTSIILLTVQFYDRMLFELTTLDLLWISIWGAVAGGIAAVILGVLAFFLLGKTGKPKLYNISGVLFLLFAVLMYIHCRDIRLGELTMATFISILVFHIFTVLMILFILSRKVSLVLTFGVSFITFISFLTVNYYDMMFMDLMIGDLLWYAICGVIAGMISLILMKAFIGRWGDFNLSGGLILAFAILMYIHCGNIELRDVVMGTFISVLTIFSFFLIIGIFVITKIYKHQKDKQGGKWQ